MIAIALHHDAGGVLHAPETRTATFDYNMAIPMMLEHYFPPGSRASASPR